ncbi:zinc-dependent alcohol dehydrogenase family protein [Crenobacter luteus]|uniref:Alcohol dehydrogenase n=1 Tax=Crenobacter luteus TaxID=1452487 RepID=A0A161SDP6_9NEIS|nr:zinc-dependent alcohol dehydrogenase family protein [Crenobacter luteus]KZE34473.1 alcohol dehydrogenase [Crenobacter luteus]
MRAMQSQAPGEPLVLVELPVPSPGPGQLLIRVAACGVCRTDLHVVDGDLPRVARPVIPGHEIVGTVAGIGPDCAGFALGQRVGVPWLAHTCGGCAFCRAGRENLCDAARFTGYTVDGGYAEYAVADARFCLALPAGYDDLAVAPLLCAGLIGYRALRLAGDARRLGLYGFGAAAHIVAQVARAEGRAVYAFTRPLDATAQAFAREMGAAWAGGSDAPPPEPLDAALIFASVGALVPAALAAVERGGTVVCAGIHMSDIPSFPYALLWGERTLRSVANLTRADGAAFMSLAARVPIATRVVPYPLEDANAALAELRDGRIEGAAVLRIAG